MNIQNAAPPSLARRRDGEVATHVDPALIALGVVVAFTERTGGVSAEPYESLNLASHVSDDPIAVDENRQRALSALGLGHLRGRLVMAEQVHGERIVRVGSAEAGAGAFANAGAPSIPQADALMTSEPDLPLMLCFADCVPVILVAPAPAIAVVHAGWRGALAGLPGKTARELAESSGCAPADLRAYVGPHIGACHYEVGDEILSQFVNAFGTVARADSGGLDLGRVVTRNLTDAGVLSCSITSLGSCTAEETDRFFSYRAEGGLTGRHAAVACLASPSR